MVLLFSTLSPYVSIWSYYSLSSIVVLFYPYGRESRTVRIQRCLQSAWGRGLLLCLGGKGFENWNPGLKNVIFEFLKSHQFDVSIQPIANSRTTKISLLCQFEAILTRIFGQYSQLLQCKMGLTSLHNFYGSWHLYICRSLLGHPTFITHASLVFMKGTSCRVIGRK